MSIELQTRILKPAHGHALTANSRGHAPCSGEMQDQPNCVSVGRSPMARSTSSGKDRKMLGDPAEGFALEAGLDTRGRLDAWTKNTYFTCYGYASIFLIGPPATVR